MDDDEWDIDEDFETTADDLAKCRSPETLHSDDDSSRTSINHLKTSRKRARTRMDGAKEDLASQQPITKWMRPMVPGPLQDVMKKQNDCPLSLNQDGTQCASGRSIGHAVHISTVFDDGPWVEMCSYLGINVTSGKLYGGIKFSSLRHTITHILDDDQSSPKISQLLCLVKSLRYVDEEIVAIFHDPTGSIDGYFHRDVVEQVGPALTPGVGVLLRDVSVFSATNATMSGFVKRYLNVIPRNVERIFIPASQSNAYDQVVSEFNLKQGRIIAEEIEQSTRAETIVPVEDQIEHVLAPEEVRQTTNQLSFISQRQVIHRHQPVCDGASATTAASTNAQTGNGLGRWQWHQLAQKNQVSSTGSENHPPIVSLSTTARFKDLLSQRLLAKKSHSNDQANLPISSNNEFTSSINEETKKIHPPKPPSIGSVRKRSVYFAASSIVNDDDDW